MCGINVIHDPQHHLANLSILIRFMNAEMIYRGPDSEGTFVKEDIGMGVRRLSIIDVNGGQQPLYSEDASIVLICNGEIYNYIELRRELIAKGHRFSTQSDCEVIPHLYEEMGIECLAKLRGMFALALWDQIRKLLFVARDRAGIKPLYFAIQDGVLFLSSELKAILKTGLIRPTLEPRAVWQYLHYGFPIDQGQTVINNIGRVRPGEYVIADEYGVHRKLYWQPPFGGKSENGVRCSVEETRRHVLSVLEDSVRRHLRSDVPVGVMLSGGIDSSTIAALSTRNEVIPTALCTGYMGKHACDERDVAHSIATFLGILYEDIVLDEQMFAQHFHDFSKIVDEPVADVAAMPQWAIYDRASQFGYKVLLSGIGGDELFFGYPLENQIGEKMARRLTVQKALPDSFLRLLSRYADFAATVVKLVLGRGAMKFRQAAEWLSPDGYTGLNEINDYYSSLVWLQSCGTDDFIEAGIDSDKPLLELQSLATRGPELIYAELFGSYLPYNGCFFADKLGMGRSVEVRVPFLDDVLIETILALPLHVRYNPRVPKALLRETMRGILPDDILDRPKQGFAPPNAFVIGLVNKEREAILSGKLCSTWVDCDKIADLLTIPGASNFLYRLLVFESWFSSIYGAPVYS